MSAQTTYPLSPLQQGMLFHALSEPHGGVDIEQLVFTLREPVEASRLRAAWERVVARHGILRTAFQAAAGGMQQTVHKSVALPFVVEDAPGMDAAAFATWLKADRARGFSMESAPLMRFHLFHRADDDWCLVWTFHHILLDGRSFPPLIREAFGFYDSPDAPEPAAARSYADFIAWHAALDHAASEKFWREQLKGFRAPTPLAIEGLGTLTAEREQGDAEVLLSAETTSTLIAFAAQNGVTLNTLVQAAWAILLHRYSGEEDVCFGATRACRRGTLDGAEVMVGLFINTVPVRTSVSADRTLTTLLHDLRAGWVAMRPHEHTPLARVQAGSEVPPGQPLFHTLVVFENYDLPSHFRDLGGPWERRELRLHEQTSFPICLAAYAGERLRLVAEYDRSRLDDALVRALLSHVRSLLEAMPLHAGGTIGDLTLLTGEEATAAMAANTRDFPVSETLHAQFSRQAALTPHSVALVQGESRMTYAELESRAAALAVHLASLGVRTESIVGLCMERCPELVVGMLGIVRANAAYLPIDLAYPPERLAFMLEDAQAPVLLTQRHLADRLPPGHGAKLVFIEDVPDAPADAASLEQGSPDQLCYVLYTSGSTGKPKGCCITHRNVARLFTATEAWFGFGPQDVWTLFHSTAFDFSVWELWGALLYGGRLVVVPFEVSRSPEQFHELLVREGVTVLNQTPSAFRQLVAADALSADSRKLALRYVVFGGEALEMQSLKPWFDRHGDARPQLVNMYGITETTVHVTYRPLKAGDVARGSVIGVPIPDLQLLTLDAQLRPVPVGVAGELFVGGAGLARGYLQREELTAARFIPHPGVPGGRLYRTGDLARRLPDGDLEYLGRIDHQVKIRGFRIELGEIESVLLRHPRIREAAVLAREDGHGGRRLVAWVVENKEAPEAGAPELRAHLKAFVPDYMVPSAFVRLEQMPLTTNGKLDARALPAPAEEREAAAEFAPPRTTAEQALAEIWQRVLKVQRVGIHDNFFELGGDSILTILVVSQARQQGLAITPKQLFDFPTIAALAERAGAAGVQVQRMPERALEGDVPLTPIQRWFFDHEFLEPQHWNQSFTFTLNEVFTSTQIAAAMAQVVAAHPVFRLRFTREGDTWTQSFSPLPTAESLVFEADSSALQRALSLAGPFLRYTYEEATKTLSIAIHHLIVDGVSWRVLLEDLHAALRSTPLPPRTTGFHTWAHAMATAEAPRDEASHWNSIPAPTPLPRDGTGGENLEHTAQTHQLSLSVSDTAALRSLRTQDALLAALAHGLSAWDGAMDHTLEMEGHGREESTLAELAGLPTVPDLSHTIGWFTTIYPVHLQTGANPSETLKAITTHLSTMPRRGFGRSLGGMKPGGTEILFNYLGEFDHTVEGLPLFHMHDLDTTGWHAPSARRTHALELNCLVQRGQLQIRITYSTALHRAETVARFADAMSVTLKNLAAGERFALARLDPATLEHIAKAYPGAEDVFPLSPMQRLFLAVETARPGSGTDQWHCRISGPLNAARLREAWNAVMRRHGTLRTAYVSTSTEPHQVVMPEAAIPWHHEDLRGTDPSAQEQRLAAFLAADASRPFDVSKAPLTRLALLQLGDEDHVLVWTHHHLEIDGWSWPLVFRELHAHLDGEPLPRPPRYRDYIAWLAQRPGDPAFWRAQLAGFRTPTPLPFSIDRTAPAAEVPLRLSDAETAALGSVARRLLVTPNALVQAAWAVLLGHHGAQSEVVFGAAFSGRPADLPGADATIGHFVNNLPVRASFAADTPFSILAQSLHRRLAELAEHQNTALTEIEGHSELPWNARLFSTLVVFQNYLAAETRMGEARITSLHAPVRTNYPVTLVVNPGVSLEITLISQPGVAGCETLTALAEQLASLLRNCSPTASIAALRASLPSPAASLVSTASTAHPGTSAATNLEKAIAAIWASAFGREVSTTENFFDLGGHSLLMLRVHARLVEQLRREIPVVTLFQHPTIRALAQALGDRPVPANTTLAAAAQDRAAKARAAMARRPLPPKKT